MHPRSTTIRLETTEDMSPVFYFRTAPDILTLADNLPQKFLVPRPTAARPSCPGLPPSSKQAMAAVAHVGGQGARGQLFMNEIQNMSAFLPYMVDPGNHEQSFRFAHYTEYFRNQPKNAVVPMEAALAGLCLCLSISLSPPLGFIPIRPHQATCNRLANENISTSSLPFRA